MKLIFLGHTASFNEYAFKMVNDMKLYNRIELSLSDDCAKGIYGVTLLEILERDDFEKFEELWKSIIWASDSIESNSATLRDTSIFEPFFNFNVRTFLFVSPNLCSQNVFLTLMTYRHSFYLTNYSAQKTF